MAAGHSHCLAYDEAGSCYSWGNGGYGRLGHKVTGFRVWGLVGWVDVGWAHGRQAAAAV